MQPSTEFYLAAPEMLDRALSAAEPLCDPYTTDEKKKRLCYLFVNRTHAITLRHRTNRLVSRYNLRKTAEHRFNLLAKTETLGSCLQLNCSRGKTSAQTHYGRSDRDTQETPRPKLPVIFHRPISGCIHTLCR